MKVNGPNAIVPAARTTWNVCETEAAALCPASPACVASSVHVPALAKLSVNRVMSAVVATLHTSAVDASTFSVTARPELAEAITVGVVP